MGLRMTEEEYIRLKHNVPLKNNVMVSLWMSVVGLHAKQETEPVCYARSEDSKNLSDMKAVDSYAIAALMLQVEGWEKTSDRCSMPLYGRQRLYRRRQPIDPPAGREAANKETFDFLD